MIKKIDAYITSYFPVLVAGYFIYNNTAFASHIFAVCWLSMVVNMTFVLETYKVTFTTKNSLFSLFNLFAFGGLAYFGYISVEGFLLSVIIGENAAMILAIIYAFLFKKGINNDSAWNTFGVGGTIGFILLFLAAIYPYLGEWILYLNANAELMVILGAIFSFILNINRKIKTLENTTNRRKNNPKYDIDKQLERAMDTKNMMPEAVHIIVSLGIWFIGLGILYAIYVSNA